MNLPTYLHNFPNKQTQNIIAVICYLGFFIRHSGAISLILTIKYHLLDSGFIQFTYLQIAMSTTTCSDTPGWKAKLYPFSEDYIYCDTTSCVQIGELSTGSPGSFAMASDHCCKCKSTCCGLCGDGVDMDIVANCLDDGNGGYLLRPTLPPNAFVPTVPTNDRGGYTSTSGEQGGSSWSGSDVTSLLAYWPILLILLPFVIGYYFWTFSNYGLGLC